MNLKRKVSDSNLSPRKSIQDLDPFDLICHVPTDAHRLHGESGPRTSASGMSSPNMDRRLVLCSTPFWRSIRMKEWSTLVIHASCRSPDRQDRDSGRTHPAVRLPRWLRKSSPRTPRCFVRGRLIHEFTNGHQGHTKDDAERSWNQWRRPTH